MKPKTRYSAYLTKWKSFSKPLSMKSAMIKKLLAILAFAGLITSCSPAKKLNRLLSRHPELVATDTIRIKLDTFTREIPFKFPDREDFFTDKHPLSLDTGFYFPADFYQDTTILENDNIMIRLVRKKRVGDILGTGLEVSGTIKPQKVTIEKAQVVEKIKLVKQDWIDRYGIYLKYIIVAFILLMLYLILKKIF